MKMIVNFKQVKYVYFIIWMTLFSNISLGSSMSQVSGARPVHLLDICNRSVPGYSIETSIARCKGKKIITGLPTLETTLVIGHFVLS